MKPINPMTLAKMIETPPEPPPKPARLRVVSIRLTEQQYREVLALTGMLLQASGSGSMSISKAAAMLLEAGVSATVQHLSSDAFQAYQKRLDNLATLPPGFLDENPDGDDPDHVEVN